MLLFKLLSMLWVLNESSYILGDQSCTQNSISLYAFILLKKHIVTHKAQVER